MKILIVGASGFLGRNLSEFYLRQGHRVYTYSRAIGLSLQNSNQLLPADVIDFIASENPELIFYLSNTLNPKSDYSDYVSHLQNVYFQLQSIINVCNYKNLEKFVYFSSGGALYNPKILSNEESPLEPLNLYGFSKLECENYLRFKSSEVPVLIVRPTNPYGRYQSLTGKQGLIAVLIGASVSGDAVTIFSPLESAKNYIFIDDLLEIIDFLSKNHVGVFNIGTPKNTTILELITIVERIGRTRIKYTCEAPHNNIIHSHNINFNKLNKVIDGYSFTDISAGVGYFYDSLAT